MPPPEDADEKESGVEEEAEPPQSVDLLRFEDKQLSPLEQQELLAIAQKLNSQTQKYESQQGQRRRKTARTTAGREEDDAHMDGAPSVLPGQAPQPRPSDGTHLIAAQVASSVQGLSAAAATPTP